ncbi:hypothetical protein K474DRAFT_187133 [Panus rudis PR-1116 ss-1]|nr:hypothetical protein K474DRAFT_187133 [Panus rudis PR-1116 ss-1]
MYYMVSRLFCQLVSALTVITAIVLHAVHHLPSATIVCNLGRVAISQYAGAIFVLLTALEDARRTRRPVPIPFRIHTLAQTPMRYVEVASVHLGHAGHISMHIAHGTASVTRWMYVKELLLEKDPHCFSTANIASQTSHDVSERPSLMSILWKSAFSSSLPIRFKDTHARNRHLAVSVLLPLFLP